MTALIRIGTRASTMALAQTDQVATALRAADPSSAPEIVSINPRGDRNQISKFNRHGGKGGAFVAEIREALRAGALEAAMHSLKDMPGDEQTPGLIVGAMLERDNAADALVLRNDLDTDNFRKTKAAGLKIGTNSVRRAAFLRRLYPKAEIIHYRGAADTRLKKLDARIMQKLPDGGEAGPADALVMAASGLQRIGMAHRIAHEFSFDEMLPAVGQGIVAVECVETNWAVRAHLGAIDHLQTRACAEAEREVLWVLNGHCNSPIAGHAQILNGVMKLTAAVISEDARQLIISHADGAPDRPREIGRAAALDLVAQGAQAIIEATRMR